LCALAHWFAPWKLDGLRLVVFAAEAVTAILIWRWLRETGRPTSALALYWCNPLMAFCLTGQAHIDASLAPPILVALLAAGKKRGLSAGIALGLAVGVKLWPLLLAPLLARTLWPDRTRLTMFSLALGAVTLITCGPLLWASLSAKAGLTAYAAGWSINNAPFHWLSWLFVQMFGPGAGETIVRIAIVVVAACASLYAGLLSWNGPQALFARAAVLAAALFYLSPAQFPWYAAWFVPLAAASVSWVLSFGAIGLPVYFLFFPLISAGQRDLFDFWLAAFHLAPLIAAVALRRRLTAQGAIL
jgi:alpha-1,6-mannosyltransferase